LNKPNQHGSNSKGSPVDAHAAVRVMKHDIRVAR